MRVDVYEADHYLGGYHVGSVADLRVGRGRKNQIILPHRTVSRHHANLIRQGNSFLVMDRSTNGTWVKGKKVEKALLEGGDEFVVGPYVLRLTEDEPEWDRETEVKNPPGSTENFEGLVGSSPVMLQLFDMTKRVAESNGTVLVMGETGCGKELVARGVHNRSPRSSGPFVAINCGAISRDLVESELFGHDKGAFTGASAARKGAFEQADGGTLFLDEVGELSLDLQPKLLRVLETGEIRRIGSQRSTEVDVRVVAATHRDLKKEVEDGRFRADLLYRLYVLPVAVPALRDRREDIPHLVHYFLGPRGELQPEALERLMGHAWLGNVRELKNVLERACILRKDNPIGPADLIFLDEGSDEQPADVLAQPFSHTLEELERMYYMRALEKTDGNIRAAARSLGIAKSTFYDRLRRYGLSQENGGDRGEED